MDRDSRQYLPILLDVTEREILLIGAGRACAEKLHSLRQTGKPITVIAPEFSEPFLQRENDAWMRRIPRKFRKGDLGGFGLIYVGVDDPDAEREILEEARREKIPVNFLNHVGQSDFISPSALVRRSFAIFISTFGRGPGATKRIRKEIEENLDLEALDRETEEYIRRREERK